MITYNDLYEVSRKERYSKQLQKLSRSFVEDVADYLSEKKKIVARDEGDFSDVILKTKKQLENAMTLFKELMRTRKEKILNLVLIATETGISKQDFDNMLDFEKSLFEDFMKCVDISNKKLESVFNGKREEELKNKMIVFLEDVKEFVGLGGEKMGPYSKGDIVNIQKEIADILIGDGKAESSE